MSEWKSWSMGGEDSGISGLSFASAQPAAGSAAPSAPSAAPEVDEAAAKWGTEVQDVSLDRIEKVMQGDGLPTGRGEFVVVTEVDGKRMQVHREPADCPWMQIEAIIPGEAVVAEDLNERADTWNTTRLQPTAFAVPREGGVNLVLATRYFVAEGLSDRQIHALLRRGIGVTIQAMNELTQSQA